MRTEIYEDKCPMCEFVTMILYETDGHERDASGTKETCLRCGAIRNGLEDWRPGPKDYNMHKYYLQSYSDDELEKEIKYRKDLAAKKEEERLEKLSVMVWCPLCKGDTYYHYPHGCNCCFSKLKVKAVKCD